MDQYQQPRPIGRQTRNSQRAGIAGAVLSFTCCRMTIPVTADNHLLSPEAFENMFPPTTPPGQTLLLPFNVPNTPVRPPPISAHGKNNPFTERTQEIHVSSPLREEPTTQYRLPMSPLSEDSHQGAFLANQERLTNILESLSGQLSSQ